MFEWSEWLRCGAWVFYGEFDVASTASILCNGNNIHVFVFMHILHLVEVLVRLLLDV